MIACTNRLSRLALLPMFVALALAACVMPKASAEPKDDASDVLTTLKLLTLSLSDEFEISAEDIDKLTATIKADTESFTSPEVIAAASRFIKAYDLTHKPLWMGEATLHQKETKPGDEIHWAVFWTMQHLLDQLYNNEGIRTHTELIQGLKFATADYFPGKVSPVEDPEAVYTVKIQGSYPDTWGPPVFHGDRPARKPTGAYLVPGDIATVTVPESLVGKGYQVRVGAHSWDHTKKPKVLRLFRVSTVFDIDRAEMSIANPLGGGIYIEVPPGADAGVVEVSIQNAVRSPYFSSKPFHTTTDEEWRETERNFDAPWADFQSRQFQMQVPTSWVTKLDDPSRLMGDWDKSMAVMNALMGRPEFFGRETMYSQVDTQLRGRAFHPGYPSGNGRYDPNRDYGGTHTHHLARGPQHAHSYEFHEQGHAYLFTKFPGGREAVVNLPHVTVFNEAFGIEINEAFRSSRSIHNEFVTLSNTAIAWMMSDTFGGRINGYERQYQAKGHAFYVEIARLYGWEALGRYWRSINEDKVNGIDWPTNAKWEDLDRLVIRLSESVGADIRPLVHFWGFPMNDLGATQAALDAAGVPRSAKLYDLLVSYRDSVPADNAAFRAFALKWWEREPKADGFTTERNHAARWESYDAEEAKRVRAKVDAMLKLYFPAGRPGA